MPVNVRLITPITTKGFRRLEDLAAFETPDIRISLASTRTGPGSIESAYESAFSEPGTVARIRSADRNCRVDIRQSTRFTSRSARAEDTPASYPRAPARTGRPGHTGPGATGCLILRQGC